MYKKKKKNKIWIFLLILIIIVAAAFGIIKYKSLENKEADTTVEIQVSKNQQLLNLTISQILGNEISVYETSGDSSLLDTWMIPVGTEVVTKLGTTTTFSRLASGDKIQMLVEKTDNGLEIIKIWIVN